MPLSDLEGVPGLEGVEPLVMVWVRYVLEPFIKVTVIRLVTGMPPRWHTSHTPSPLASVWAALADVPPQMVQICQWKLELLEYSPEVKVWLASLRCCGQPEVAVQACQCLAVSQVQPEAALWALVAGMDTVFLYLHTVHS